MRNFLKQELIKSNIDFHPYVKSFAVTDALYKGTALTANVLFSTILIRLPFIVPDIILFSTYFHFIFIGLLELPTSFLADNFNSAKITIIGFLLKFISTILFFFIVFFAFENKFNLCIQFMIMESFLDGVSNSLLSGCYQASIIRKLKSEGHNPNGLFVNSLRFSVPLRLLIPIIGVLGFYFLNLKDYEQMYYLVGYVLLLRVIVILRVSHVFKNFPKVDKVEGRKSDYFKLLSKDILLNKEVLTAAAFYSLIISSSTAYFLPNLQLLLSPINIKVGILEGTLLSLAFYFKVIILGWVVTKFSVFTNLMSNHKRILLFLIGALIGFGLSELLIDNKVTRLIFEYVFIFLIYFASYFGIRKATDVISECSENSTESGLISSFEAVSMLAFCILTPIGFYMPMQSFYLFLIASFILMGTTLFYYEKTKKIAA